MANRTERPPLALIIDDDPVVRLLVGETLSKEGLEVREAEDGESGLAIFETLLPDIVFLDVIMPGMDGYAVCEKIRQGPANCRQIPIVMLTGLEDVESINRAYEVGATDFVAKPLNWAVLPHRVRYILRSSRALAQLSVSEAMLARAQRLAKLVSWDLEIASGELHCASEIDHLLGRDNQRPLQRLEELLAYIREESRQPVFDAFQKAGESGIPINAIFRVVRSSGEEAIFHAQSDGEAPSGVLSGTLQDITEQYLNEERITFLALHDELTGLPNRSLFKELVAHELAQAHRHGFKVAGLFLDLDKFQRINDTFGHEVGDRLLVLTAAQLVGIVRDSDFVSRCGLENFTESGVARLGGDEFGVLLTGIRTIDDAARASSRILNQFAKPFQIGDREFYLDTSIGVTIFPDDCTDLDSFMKHGDAAMHVAKKHGTSAVEFFSPALNLATSRKLHIETLLRRAVENQELELHYQPKIDATTGRISGVEALVRWRNQELGMVMPMQFIPIAEESGLIVPIGDWVLREACRQSAIWESQGLEVSSVAVNLSANQFRLTDICRRIATVIEESDTTFEHIEIELTESMLVDDIANSIRKMHELRDLGLKLSIDDFGTGYSSLSYLIRFPLHALKIDKSFIREIAAENGHPAITTAIIAMAKSLELEVVAEGVENERQVSWLRENHCDVLQGYFFSKPMPGEAFTKFYREYSCPIPETGSPTG